MKDMRGTAIIRDRGQLTIPDKFRELLKWPSSNSVVSIATISGNELIIKPYQSSSKTDWNKVWEEIYKSRSLKGKHGNLSNFIVSDRAGH